MKKNIRILIGRFRHWSLKYKILTIVLFNSVTMLLCAVFGYRLYTNAYNKLLFDSMASRLSVTSAQISQKMENAEYISNLILGSSSIQDCLSDQGLHDQPWQMHRQMDSQAARQMRQDP